LVRLETFSDLKTQSEKIAIDLKNNMLTFRIIYYSADQYIILKQIRISTVLKKTLESGLQGKRKF